MDELIQEKMLEAVNKVSGGVIGVHAVQVDDINCLLAHVADFLLEGGTVYNFLSKDLLVILRLKLLLYNISDSLGV